MSTASEALHRARNLAFSDLGAGVGRHVHHGVGSTHVRVRMEAGAVLPEHAHVHEQYTLVIAGRLRIRINGDRPDERVVDLEAGDGLWLPSLLPHEATALEPTQTVEIFVPGRPELEESPHEASPQEGGHDEPAGR